MDTIDPPWPVLTPEEAPTAPEKPKASVAYLDKPPYRVLPEMIVRHLLGQVDKLEDVMVMFRVKGEPGINMNYSSDISMSAMCVMATSLSQMAQARMSYAYGHFVQPPNPNAPEAA